MRLGAGSSIHSTPSAKPRAEGPAAVVAMTALLLPCTLSFQGSASCEGFGAVLVKKLCVLTLQMHLSALKERCLSFQGDYFEILRGKVQAEDESCVHLSDVS